MHEGSELFAQITLAWQVDHPACSCHKAFGAVAGHELNLVCMLMSVAVAAGCVEVGCFTEL